MLRYRIAFIGINVVLEGGESINTTKVTYGIQNMFCTPFYIFIMYSDL